MDRRGITTFDEWLKKVLLMGNLIEGQRISLAAFVSFLSVGIFGRVGVRQVLIRSQR